MALPNKYQRSDNLIDWLALLYDEISTLQIQMTGSRVIGDIRAFAFETVPSQWLECNGAAVSRTTYAALFTAIGDTFGVGDGSTTFNVPDLRGEFIRGWAHGSTNDPDKATRTDSGDGTTGDKVGTKQADALEAHTHRYFSDTLQNWRGSSGNIFGGGAGTDNADTGSTGGNETRPRNVYMMYCIYAGV